jgi:hypothetical protein
MAVALDGDKRLMAAGMNVQFVVCPDCQRTTSGDCGQHGPWLTSHVTGTPTTTPTPHVCPVCQGRQVVPIGFYSLFSDSANIAAPEPCRTCDGSGIVWGK